jgi:hypothetical protein
LRHNRTAADRVQRPGDGGFPASPKRDTGYALLRAS